MTNRPSGEALGPELASAIAQDLKTLAGLVSGAAAERGASLRSADLFVRLRGAMAAIGGEVQRVHQAAQARREEQVGQLRGALDLRARWIEAYALRKRSSVPPRPDRFVLAGRVMDRGSGVPLPNAVIAVTDREKRSADVLASTRTDALGYFRVDFTEAHFKNDLAKRPSIRVEVRDVRGKAVEVIADSLAPKPGASEFVDAAIDAAVLAVNLEQGRALQTSARIALQRCAASKALVESRLGPRRSVDRSPPAAVAAGAGAATVPAAIVTGHRASGDKKVAPGSDRAKRPAKKGKTAVARGAEPKKR
jgi:hypothetical protein